MTKGEIVGQKLKLSLMSIIDDNDQSQGSPKEAPRWVQQAQKWKIMDSWYNSMGRLEIAMDSLESYK